MNENIILAVASKTPMTGDIVVWNLAIGIVLGNWCLCFLNEIGCG